MPNCPAVKSLWRSLRRMRSIDMQDEAIPDPKFRRFEKVLLTTEGAAAGQGGVVVWCDLCRFSAYDQGFKKPPQIWSEWVYSVYLPERDRYGSFKEFELQTTGCFDPEENHFGKRFEVSFDTASQDDSRIEEGCYRLPGRFWEVFVFIKADVAELRHHPVTWPSGISGVQFDVPDSAVLNHAYIIRAMTEAFAAGSCTVARGPDSLLLK